VSDNQIRDLTESAEEWSPDVHENQDDDDDGSNGAAGLNPSLPALQLGSDVEIATCVAQVLCQERGDVIFSEGDFWYYAGSHWRPIEDSELRCVVHHFDGAWFPGGRSPAQVKLGRARIDSILFEMGAKLARPDFFAEAPVGINCARGSSPLRQMERQACCRISRSTIVGMF
jgi:hypothetical protein